MANNFTRGGTRDIGTTFMSVGATVPNSTKVVVFGLSLANVTTSPVTVSVVITTVLDVDIYLVKDAPVPVGGSLIMIGSDQKVILVTGDRIRVKSSAAASIDAVISYMEIT